MASRRRILAVDDEPDILTIYTVNLELAGHDIVTARDGVEALTVLHTTPHPDVILLDIMMPRLDGWAVLRRLVEDDALAQVPVIMVSAKVTTADRQRASAMGAAAFLAKPFTTASLLDVIERTASLSSMASVLTARASTSDGAQTNRSVLRRGRGVDWMGQPLHRQGRGGRRELAERHHERGTRGPRRGHDGSHQR